MGNGLTRGSADAFNFLANWAEHLKNQEEHLTGESGNF